ncbi:MAG: hypothetical protein KGZ79_13705 [Dethiobacter sp.]|jgi:hypothetical protein|nr:hypothetical protein [Dethiobacter sp.]
MCEYYFDDERAIAYKIYPVVSSTLKDEKSGVEKAILVHTNVKATNFKKEKARRPLSEVYPLSHYDKETAVAAFYEKILARVLDGARKISEQEYDLIKNRVEVGTV